MNKNKLFSVLVPLVSVLLAFLIGCIIMVALKANPGTALGALWKGAFGSKRSVGTTLSRATPLIFTSLCACFAYRCGVFNLGSWRSCPTRRSRWSRAAWTRRRRSARTS